MEKKFELGDYNANKQDTNRPEIARELLTSEAKLESNKEPGPNQDQEETEPKRPKKNPESEKYPDAKEYRNRINMWNDLFKRQEKEIKKELEDRERKAEEEQKLQDMQN